MTDSIGQRAGSASPSEPAKPWRAQKPDAQAFDRITIDTVPRYKESHLSGDEWRISATVQFWRKGVMVHEEGCRNVEVACRFLAYWHANACDNGKGYFAGERDICDQEGCSERATVTYRLKAEYTLHDGIKKPPSHMTKIRCFCERHKRRGDCGLEDADTNYEKVDP